MMRLTKAFAFWEIASKLRSLGDRMGWLRPQSPVPPMSVHSEEPVSIWIELAKQGDHDAIERLWNRFYARLRHYCASSLGTLPRRVGDEDDLAAQVFSDVIDRAQVQGFRKLNCRVDLWQVLAMVAGRAASNLRRQQAQRREVGESVLYDSELLTDHPMAHLRDVGEEVDLEMMQTECEHLFNALTPQLREAALLRVAGYTNAEIAELMDRHESTVEHYFSVIRGRWSRWLHDNED